MKDKKIRRQFGCLRIFCLRRGFRRGNKSENACGLGALQQGDIVSRAGIDHLLRPDARLDFTDMRSAE